MQHDRRRVHQPRRRHQPHPHPAPRTIAQAPRRRPPRPARPG
ncbi:cobyric acid synthase, partial [Burkholderia multivorans]